MAKKDAIALIVAGSGEMTKDEVFDLLEDAYPLDGYEEVGLIFPTDKALFTKTVEHVIAWHDVEDSRYPVHTEGESYSRTSSKFGDDEQKVESWLDNLTPAEFKDWDVVHFLLALPDPDAEDYDTYAEMAEVAIENGLKVLNLASGLDDVVLADPEPEPEPDPEPEEKPARRRGRARKQGQEEPEEKPARRSRARREEPAEAPAEDPAAEDTQEEAAEPEKATSAASGTLEDQVSQAFLSRFSGDQGTRVLDALDEIIGGLQVLREEFERAAIPQEVPSESAEPEEKPKARRGRGRPRTNFAVKQILDEDSGEWVPRPMGRLRKGTEFRTINEDTGEVLETGTA